MFLIKGVDIFFAVKPPVHHQLNFFQLKKINVCKQFLDGLYIRNVPRQLSVIHRQSGFFAKKQRQVDLGKRVMVFIMPPSHLFDDLGIRGYGGRIISQILSFQPSLYLKQEEVLLGIFGNGGEKFTTSLRWDIGAERMQVGRSPFWKTA